MPERSERSRSEVIAALASAVSSLRLDHPTRVAIEGRSAAGKTTLADELADVIRSHGGEVIRASIDDFHRPGHKFRSQRGEWTPRTYYEEGYDYAAFRDFLLQPARSERHPALPHRAVRLVPRCVATRNVACGRRPRGCHRRRSVLAAAGARYPLGLRR